MSVQVTTVTATVSATKVDAKSLFASYAAKTLSFDEVQAQAAALSRGQKALLTKLINAHNMNADNGTLEVPAKTKAKVIRDYLTLKEYNSKLAIAKKEGPDAVLRFTSLYKTKSTSVIDVVKTVRYNNGVASPEHVNYIRKSEAAAKALDLRACLETGVSFKGMHRSASTGAMCHVHLSWQRKGLTLPIAFISVDGETRREMTSADYDLV
jgi:hypothetical protein